MRYWPQRVYDKLVKDPSLAVAHSDYGQYSGRDLFKELHPEMAKKWEQEQAKNNPDAEPEESATSESPQQQFNLGVE